MQDSLNKSSAQVLDMKAKLGTTQARLTDSMEEIKNVQEREQLARIELKEQQTTVKAMCLELTTAKNEIEAVQEELKSQKEIASHKSTNDAMLRRLNNESLYLKSQLQNELTCKTELIRKAEFTENELRQLRVSSKTQVESLKSTMQKQKEISDAAQSCLNLSNQGLEAEVLLQRDQLHEIKDAYAKVRDQLRIDQVSTEQMRATTFRLAQELRAAQDKLTCDDKAAKEAASRHAQNTEAISLSLREAETVRAKEVADLQNELAAVLQESSDAQKEMIDLKQKINSQKVLSAKMQSAHAIFFTLNHALKIKKVQFPYLFVVFSLISKYFFSSIIICRTVPFPLGTLALKLGWPTVLQSSILPKLS